MKPEDLKLQNCWEAFAAAVIPAKGAPPGMREAMYTAYLAGCDTVLQYAEALHQHAPTNVRTGLEAWRKDVEGELKRLGQEVRQ